MLKFAVAVSLSFLSSSLWAIEVASIVSCKPEGDRWLCAAYQNDQIHVFRSDFYQTKVEFKGALVTDKAMPSPATAPVMDAPINSAGSSVNSTSASVSASIAGDGLPEGRYTVQLLACNAIQCKERIQRLQGIAGSQVVELKVQDRLMNVLIVGGYPNYKTAQKAAADLMTRYQIADKPWIRTIDSLRKNLIRN